MIGLVRYAVIILATLGLLLVVWQFRLALVLFALSLIVAATVRPLVDALVKRGMSRSLAIALVYTLGMGLFVGGVFLVGRPMLEELSRGTNNFIAFYERISVTWPEGTQFQRAIAAQLPPPAELYQAIAGKRGEALAGTVLGVAQNFFLIVSEIFIVLFLSVYWAIDRVHFERLWLSVLPARQRNRALEVWRSVENGVASYVRSEVVQSLMAWLLLGVGYWLLGVNYPVILALAGAVLRLIPWMGAILAVILTLVISLGVGSGVAVAAAVYTLIVLLVLELVVEPRLFARWRFSSLLIVVVLVAMADAFGLLGLIIAPPLAALIQTVFRSLRSTSAPAESVNPHLQIANLQTRLDRLHQLAADGDELSPENTNLMTRLEELLQETKAYIGDQEDGAPSLGLPATEGGRRNSVG